MSEKHDIENRVDTLKNEILDARASLSDQKTSKKKTVYSELNPVRIIVEIVAGLGVGMVLGFWLDGLFDTKPVFFILCVLLGVAGSVLTIYKLAVSLDAKDKKSKD